MVYAAQFFNSYYGYYFFKKSNSSFGCPRLLLSR